MAFFANVAASFVSNPVLLVLAVALIAVVFMVTSNRKPRGKNPFATDCRRPPAPLVTDQSARDRVIKNGFVIKKVPETLDAVVVGSGIGGLGVAAMMAKAGKRVLVLEQHDQAGGCCHTFIEKGFEFDVGVHYIGEMCGSTMNKVLFDQLTEGQLQWEKLDDTLDVVALGSENVVYPSMLPCLVKEVLALVYGYVCVLELVEIHRDVILGVLFSQHTKVVVSKSGDCIFKQIILFHANSCHVFEDL
ncbi:RETSAT [Branchiostoma lanceolatum]|uniref:RETSAT protein n=1 Tax=Branchiostoma lanceolatum TaxID=7740 RepID=A0A8S4MNM8_BRALA|nr:RETSAT [Branchiostoma lanceolatum]